MLTSFLLFVIAVLLLSIFWVLSMIHSRLKQDSSYLKTQNYEKGKRDYGRPAA